MDKTHNPENPLRPALGLQLLCQTLDELGLDAEPACIETGLSRHLLETPGQLISKEQESRFIEATIRCSGREDLAFRVGLRYHYGVFGVWGLALATSANLLQALQVAQEFIELTHSFAALTFSHRAGLAEIRMEQDYPPGPVQAFVVERDLMITLMLASEIAGRRLPVDSVQVALPEPAHAKQLARMLASPVSWEAEFSAAYIRMDELEQSLPQANPITWSACVRQCRELVAMQRGPRSLESQVRDAIARTQFRGIAAVSDRLRLSERSLRRRLQDEGTSFRQIQQDLRRELAAQYLADASLSLEYIAERLGYSEPANFCHAFRGWSGETPGQARRKMQHKFE